jgi:nitroimidazol reductase NimA-like FMN-containing flavoprotein (pyridoxamine 5'-phosphate oxidase superfamily)
MEFEQTALNRVRRIPERGQYDQETIYAIIDEALICHVAFAVGEQPFVIPTIHARMGDEIDSARGAGQPADEAHRSRATRWPLRSRCWTGW